MSKESKCFFPSVTKVEEQGWEPLLHPISSLVLRPSLVSLQLLFPLHQEELLLGVSG